MSLPTVSTIKRAIPFVTNFDILQNHQFVSLSLITDHSHAHAPIPHYRAKCSRNSKRPTPCNDAELMSGRKVNCLLAQCHLLPYCLGAALNKSHLVRICPFPTHIYI